jgi:hypothetical protein
MSISAINAHEQTVHRNIVSKAVALRASLLVGCAAAITLAAWVGNPAPYLSADVELGHLLQGMALIKAGIVFAAMSLLWRRFKRPVLPGLAAAYLVGVWFAAGTSMLIWQLTAIPLAAVTFHVGGLVWLLAAWGDYKTSPKVRAALAFLKHRSSNIIGEGGPPARP